MPQPATQRGTIPADNPVAGFGYVLRGLRLLGRRGLKRYVAMPLAINVLVFGGALYWGWTRLPALQLLVEGWLPDWLDFLSTLLYPIFVLAGVLVLFFGFSLLGNLIAAPFNALLAEAVERHLTGRNPPPIGALRLLGDALRTVYSELRKILYFVLRAIPLLILFLIPGLNLAAPILWVLFSSWMLAVEYADYPLGNHGMSFPRQRALLARRRLSSLGFGSAMTLVLMIPGLNLFLIPAGVAGATAFWVERLAPLAAAADDRRG